MTESDKNRKAQHSLLVSCSSLKASCLVKRFCLNWPRRLSVTFFCARRPPVPPGSPCVCKCPLSETKWWPGTSQNWVSEESRPCCFCSHKGWICRWHLGNEVGSGNGASSSFSGARNVQASECTGAENLPKSRQELVVTCIQGDKQKQKGIFQNFSRVEWLPQIAVFSGNAQIPRSSRLNKFMWCEAN